MKICYDISQTGDGKAGCGYFAHEMLIHMIGRKKNQSFQLETNFGDSYFDPKNAENKKYTGPGVSYGSRLKNIESVQSFWESSDLEDKLGRPDIIHSNNFWCPRKIGKKTKIVYTLYDFSFLINPSWTTEENRQICISGLLSALRNADSFIAISENTKSDFRRFFPLAQNKNVKVIYPSSRFSGVSNEGSPPKNLKLLKPRKFWLCVGTIEPRKNQKMLLNAYADYLNACVNPKPLVFVGGKGWLMDDFSEQIKRLSLDKWVYQAGYMTDEELIWLYKNCFVNLYPSLFEGFGLPVLEGMSCGAAVITSNNSSIPEVSGNAGINLNPEDQTSWTTALCELNEDKPKVEAMKKASKIQSDNFSWERSAEVLSNLYEDLKSLPNE